MRPSNAPTAGGWAAAIAIASLTGQCNALNRVEAANEVERQGRSQAIAAVNATLESVVEGSEGRARGAQSEERETVREAIRTLRAHALAWGSEPRGKNAAQQWREIAEMHGRAASVAFLAAAMHAKETESISAQGTEPAARSQAGEQSQGQTARRRTRDTEAQTLAGDTRDSAVLEGEERTGDAPTPTREETGQGRASARAEIAAMIEQGTRAVGHGPKPKRSESVEWTRPERPAERPLIGPLAKAGILVYGLCAMIAITVIGGKQLRERVRGKGTNARKRLNRVAAPLRGSEMNADAISAHQGVFRETKQKGITQWLWAPITKRHPLLTPRATITACATGTLTWFCAVATTAWLLKINLGWGQGMLYAGAALVGLWNGLNWVQSRTESKFIEQFPEVVDQITRLASAGVPATEALNVIANDAPQPTGTILSEVANSINGGVDANTALKIASDKVKMAEFTMFAAVLRLQKRAGGSVSSALDNLSNKLRERRKSTMKMRSTTSQTRLTLVVLALMPVGVLLAQKVIAPEAIDMLLNTDAGVVMLRIGIGLIITGVLIARAVSKRASRA